MPRIARIIATGYPHHVTQRGNNRAVVFFDDDDRQTYLNLLAVYAQRHSLHIWAYCLMDNHVHILAVPETESALSRGIGVTNLVYTQYLNHKRNQSGRVWQNRFFSCVVGDDKYLWAVVRYIERNPVKACLTKTPESYRWSSAKAHLTRAENAMLSSPSWLREPDRANYVEFVRDKNDEIEEKLRKATRTGRPFGPETFIDELESRLELILRAKKTGRPRKDK